MKLDNHKIYRLPWSFHDNPVAILELTDLCNLQCEGCYRSRIDGHKSLEQLKEEVILLKKAGLVSIGIHIDSFQKRPGWEEKTEIELNALRL